MDSKWYLDVKWIITVILGGFFIVPLVLLTNHKPKALVNEAKAGEQSTMNYDNTLEKIENPLPLLADYPEYVEPLQYEHRYLAPPVVYEKNGEVMALLVQRSRHCRDGEST